MVLFYQLISSQTPDWYAALFQLLHKLGQKTAMWQPNSEALALPPGYLLYWPGFVSVRYLNGLPLTLQQELAILPFLTHCPFPVKLYHASGLISDSQTASSLTELLKLPPPTIPPPEVFEELQQSGRQTYLSVLHNLFSKHSPEETLTQICQTLLKEAEHHQKLAFPEFLKPFLLLSTELPQLQKLEHYIHCKINEALPAISDFFFDSPQQTGLISEITQFLQENTPSEQGATE